MDKRANMGKEKSWIWKIDILEIYSGHLSATRRKWYSPVIRRNDSARRLRKGRPVERFAKRTKDGRGGVLLGVVDRKRERERNRARGG